MLRAKAIAWALGALCVVTLFSQQKVVAQSTLFNIPSTDTVAQKKTYLEFDFVSHLESHRNGGFQTYVPQRMSGFAGVSKRRRGIEFEEFPELLVYLMRRFPNPTKSQQGAPEAQADIKYRDLKPITDETVGFNKIADELGAFSERFMTAASPGIISTTMLNAHYESHDAYLDAIAREMSKEYQAITDKWLK